MVEPFSLDGYSSQSQERFIKSEYLLKQKVQARDLCAGLCEIIQPVIDSCIDPIILCTAYHKEKSIQYSAKQTNQSISVHNYLICHKLSEIYYVVLLFQ